MHVGKKIKKYINNLGITQTYISNRTGISLPKLNLALNEKRKLTFDEYELICGVLNVDVSMFLESKKPKAE